MSFSLGVGGANDAPPNSLAGFEGHFLAEERKGNREKKGEEENERYGKHPHEINITGCSLEASCILTPPLPAFKAVVKLEQFP